MYFSKFEILGNRLPTAFHIRYLIKPKVIQEALSLSYSKHKHSGPALAPLGPLPPLDQWAFSPTPWDMIGLTPSREDSIYSNGQGGSGRLRPDRLETTPWSLGPLTNSTLTEHSNSAEDSVISLKLIPQSLSLSSALQLQQPPVILLQLNI